MVTIPNLITIGRTLLIPVIVYVLLARDYRIAFVLLVVAAFGDFIDGFLARRLKQGSDFGAVLDPLADKTTMLATVLILAAHGHFPTWLATLIVLRDVIIVTGAVAYRTLVGHVEMTPTWASKLNTLLEFTVVALVLATLADVLDAGRWLPALFLAVLATVLVSGAQYVWVWSHKAARDARGGSTSATTHGERRGG